MYCPISGIHLPRYLAAIAVGFAFVFGYEYVLHGIILMPKYLESANLWRPQAEMQALFPFMLLTQFIYTVLVIKIFALFVRTKCLGKGAIYGLLAGSIAGITMFGSYVYSPISLELAVWWFGGAAIEGLGLGLIATLIYKDAGKACCAMKDKTKTNDVDAV